MNARNLDLAQQAVFYTQSKIDMGASNRIEALFGLGLPLLCVAANRSVEIATPANSELPAWLISTAAKTESTGCGNCGEQAAVAFVYLYRKAVRPLDFMARTNADHAFVVIGRADGSLASDHATWGRNAVVCDPWDGKAYHAADIPRQMYGGGVFAPESVFRSG